MYSRSTFGMHGTLSAVLAATIVAINGLALDRGYLTAAPAGIVEVGELAAIDALPAIAMLPDVVVTASRLAAAAPSVAEG